MKAGETETVLLTQEPVQITDGSVWAYIQPLAGSGGIAVQYCLSGEKPSQASSWHTIRHDVTIGPPLVCWLRLPEGSGAVVVTQWNP